MADIKDLHQLRPIADEMLSGLHADDEMKRRVYAAAQSQSAPRRAMPRMLVPAVCCAALAFAVIGIAGFSRDSVPQPVQINTITAGIGGDDEDTGNPQLIAGLSEGANVRMAASSDESLFATGSGDIPLVAVGGGVYRLLSTPQSIGQGLRGESVGQIATFTEEPSLASGDELSAGLSNTVAEGGTVYAISGLDSRTAVAAEVNGSLRVFQRVSYAGKGPGAQSLEDTFGVRGKASSLELSGVGTLTGEDANAALDVLLDNASLVAADGTARKQFLTVTLDSGLRLQLGVSGDTLAGCGSWSCPEFFEAFEAAL